MNQDQKELKLEKMNLRINILSAQIELAYVNKNNKYACKLIDRINLLSTKESKLRLGW